MTRKYSSARACAIHRNGEADKKSRQNENAFDRPRIASGRMRRTDRRVLCM